MTSRKRRPHGEGSVHQRRDGSWAGVLDLGWIDGKRRRKYAYARTERAARAKLAELRRAAEQGQNLAARPRTVAEWLDEWLTDLKAHDGTRPSTLARYRGVVAGHLVPVLGKIRLDKLTTHDIRRLLGARRDSVAPATLVKIHAVLRSALADAERLALVPRNVAGLSRLRASVMRSAERSASRRRRRFSPRSPVIGWRPPSSWV